MELSVKAFVELAVMYLALFVTIFFMLVLLSNREKLTRRPKPMKWEPMISVIIPAFNEEEYIGRCIESVINADYPKEKLEIIIVDDGSTDRTYEIAKAYERKYPNLVKVVRKKNSGKADALNLGISLAKGEIIATLDADSYITPKVIRKMLPYFQEEGVVAVTSAVKVSNPQTFWQKLQAVEYIYTLFSRKVLEFIDSIYVTPGPFSMFKAWIFKKIGGFDRNNILEDQEIAMRIQSYNYKIRSCLEADVYTEVPRDFLSLLKQRVRWHRGGLRNSIKYLHLINPKYGDFGLIVMPLGFLSVIAIFAVLGVTIYARIFEHYSLPATFSALLFIINPVIIIGLVLLLLTIIWTYYGLKVFEKEKISFPMLLVYLLTYAYLISIFWISAIFKEIKLEELKW